jgi:hypothetical protein
MTGMQEPTRPTVLLRHDLPDGSHHIDWLIARDPAAEQRLHSFRLTCRPDEFGPGAEVRAERIFDHRPVYLTYEGPISGGRGTVRRLRAGRVTLLREDEETLEMLVEWAGGRVPVSLRAAALPGEPPFWRIVCLEIGRL